MAFSLLTKAGLTIAVVASLSVGFLGGFAGHTMIQPPPAATSPPSPVILAPPGPGACSWESEPFAGMDSADASKLTLINACGKLRGTVTDVAIVVKGERTAYHFLLKPDAEFATMVNAQNDASHGGALMIEVLPSDSFVMPKLHVNQHLEVEGPHVTDIDHGWNEIHPAKVITAV